MANTEGSVLFVDFLVSDPDHLLSSDQMVITSVRFEKLSDCNTSGLQVLGRDFLHLHGDCSGSGIELGNVDDGELVFSDKL